MTVIGSPLLDWPYGSHQNQSTDPGDLSPPRCPPAAIRSFHGLARASIPRDAAADRA